MNGICTCTRALLAILPGDYCDALLHGFLSFNIHCTDPDAISIAPSAFVPGLCFRHTPSDHPGTTMPKRQGSSFQFSSSVTIPRSVTMSTHSLQMFLS